MASCAVKRSGDAGQLLEDSIPSAAGTQGARNARAAPGRVYYARHEVTNGEYRVFLDAMAREDSAVWKTWRYDSTGWTAKPGEANHALERVYHTHPAYADYPIVNITADAAGRYCRWLNASAPSKLLYRLPTLAEQRGLLARLDTVSLQPVREGGQWRASFANLTYSPDGTDYPDIDGASYTAPVRAFRQNRQRATSVLGNVSEFNGAGSRTGGGWNESPAEAKRVIPAEGSGPGIGFRVFVEVVE